MSTIADGPLIVTAVAAESRAVLAAVRRPRRLALPGFRAWAAEIDGRPVTIVQAGIGPTRARAAMQAIATRHTLALSVGFAGGLTAEAQPGDVVLPTTVVWEEAAGTLARYQVPDALRRAAMARLPSAVAHRVHEGILFSSPAVVASVDEKRAAALRYGAVAVEMEAAALIAHAAERGADVLPLRVILDTAAVSLAGLPQDLDSSWRARAQLIARPELWGRVLSLARHVPRAAAVLTHTLAAVLPGL